MFISTAPFRIKIKNDLSFNSFVSNIARDTLSMLRHQKYSYQYIIEDVRKKDKSVSNLYNISLSYQASKAVTENSRIFC